MRFAEVFLRLGSALVAWMMMYAYFLWLAAVYVVACGPDGDEMHRLLLGFAPFVCGFAFALQVTRPFAEVHSMLRWLGVPLLLLLPFALRSIWAIFQTVHIGTSAICTDGDPPTWQLLWAPLQVLTLLVVTFVLVRVWRGASQPASNAAKP
ncbi:MAG: hypothetical protein ACR2QT_09470 [Woeseiaceae bacterium]